MPRPVATTILLPTRSTILADIGATTIWTAAIGTRRTPASRAV